MIVWLNTDGSVGEIVSSYVLTDSDGNEYTAFSPREGGVSAGGIFVYFEGGNPSGGLSYSTWELPDGSTLSVKYKASWGKECTIAFDKSRDMRKFKAEKAYEMQYFQFPADLISKGGSGIYKVGVSDSTTIDEEPVSYPYGPILFSVAENAVIRETTITKTEYDLLTAELESKADKSTLQADYQLQYSSTNVRAYYDAGKAYEDKANLAKNQYVLANNEIASGSENMELLKVYIAEDGSNAFYQCAVAMEANRPYFVYTQANATPSGVVQNVGTGLCSYYTGTDGVCVNYGQNPSEFYAFVTNKNTAKYAGEINLGAKQIGLFTTEEIDGKQVYALFADTNSTALYSPTGTSSIVLGSGSAVVDANSFSLLSGMSAKFVLANGNSLTAYVPLSLKTDPTEDDQATHKKYVDNLVSNAVNTEQSRAQEKETSLQEQINAINASQNFVATVSTEANLANIDTSKLEKGVDCVLVLKSTKSGHIDQSVVYQWGTDGAWTFVGELGDYYTKAQINEMHTEMETTCKAYSDTASATASASAVKAIFTATSSKTLPSE